MSEIDVQQTPVVIEVTEQVVVIEVTQNGALVESVPVQAPTVIEVRVPGEPGPPGDQGPPGEVTASNGLTEVDGDVQLGGTLTGDTTIVTAGNDMLVGQGNQINYATPYTAGASSFMNGATRQFWNAAVNQNGVNDRSRYYQFGAANTWLASLEHYTNDANNDDIDIYAGFFMYDSTIYGAGQYMLGTNAYYLGAYTESHLDFTGGRFLWLHDNVDVSYSRYPNTRDDSGTSAPINFLYTDPSGNVLSAPTVDTTASNGLTSVSGDIRLGGTLSGDTTVDTDVHDLLMGHGNQTSYLTPYTEGVSIQWDYVNKFLNMGAARQNAANDRDRSYLLTGSDQIALGTAHYTNDANNDDVDHASGLSFFGPSIYGPGIRYAGMFSFYSGQYADFYNEFIAGRWFWVSENEDWQFKLYLNTRDDSGTTTPANFLYTDATGKMKSAPISYIVDQAVSLRRYDESGNYQYAGFSAPGSAEGDAVWTIRRLEYASGEYVSTTEATNVTWTGRYGHTYA